MQPPSDAPLPATLKGLSPLAVGRPLADLGTLGLELLRGDLPLPVAVLKESALAHNLAWMQAFAQRSGVLLCPHGKTTMSPELFARQLQAGAWGLTAATASQVRSCRQWGVPRVLLANQLVDPGSIGVVWQELLADPGFDFLCLVDSLQGLALLQQALARQPLPRPLQVLLEVGVPGGRTGVRTLDEGLALGRALRQAAPGIALRGVEAFEGVVPAGSSADDEPGHARAELAVHTLLDTLAQLARQGCDEGWFAPGPVLLSAGGSAFFDLVAGVRAQLPAGRELQVVLRAGCTLTHDSLHYARLQARMRQRSAALWGSGPGLRNALEVWACVQALPEPGLAICNLGKRDISYDMELPQPLWWHRAGLHDAPQPVSPQIRVTALNDQHAYLRWDATGAAAGDAPAWRVGDLVGFGVAHPCTTFDKWPLLHVVDDAYRVLSGVRTCF